MTMALKNAFVALLLASLALTMVSAATKPNNVIVGARESPDRLLKFKVVKVPSKTLQVVTAKETIRGLIEGKAINKITLVKLKDQNKKGNGAKASIVEGGPDIYF